MNILAKITDERVLDVRCDEHSLIVRPDGRADNIRAARLVSAIASRYARTARQVGTLWRRLWHSLAGTGRGFEHRRPVARRASGEGGVMAGTNSIITGDKLLTAANAGDDKDATMLAKLGLVPMEAEEPLRACKALEAAE